MYTVISSKWKKRKSNEIYRLELSKQSNWDSWNVSWKGFFRLLQITILWNLKFQQSNFWFIWRNVMVILVVVNGKCSILYFHTFMLLSLCWPFYVQMNTLPIFIQLGYKSDFFRYIGFDGILFWNSRKIMKWVQLHASVLFSCTKPNRGTCESHGNQNLIF